MNRVNVSQPPVPTYGYKYGPGVFHQQMAKAGAAGDTRGQLKALDRAGLSRGGAARREAAALGGAALAEGVSQAYGQQAADYTNLANMALQGDLAQGEFAQALANMQTQQQAQRLNLLQGLL